MNVDKLKKMNEALGYIEDNLTNDIDFKEVSVVCVDD